MASSAVDPISATISSLVDPAPAATSSAVDTAIITTSPAVDPASATTSSAVHEAVATISSTADAASSMTSSVVDAASATVVALSPWSFSAVLHGRTFFAEAQKRHNHSRMSEASDYPHCCPCSKNVVAAALRLFSRLLSLYHLAARPARGHAGTRPAIATQVGMRCFYPKKYRSKKRAAKMPRFFHCRDTHDSPWSVAVCIAGKVTSTSNTIVATGPRQSVRPRSETREKEHGQKSQ